MSSIVRIFGLMGSGVTASALSRSPRSGISFMAVLRCEVSRAQDHLVAAHPDFERAQTLARVEAVLSGREIERPVVPRAAHHRAAVAERAFANRGALVHAAVGK